MCLSPLERHKLLTKKVCETPAHKQVSGRLLQKQQQGRSVSQLLTQYIVICILFLCQLLTLHSGSSGLLPAWRTV